tara:strand:- start:42188 stop:42787 length:600 start_codon:yes stop_codon:yes gene_type:complete
VVTLLFSIGCEKDNPDTINNDETTQIPVSDYPESILGHWVLDSTEDIEIIDDIEIDPIYGTETSTTTEGSEFNQSPFFDNNPMTFGLELYFTYHLTFKYDGTFDRCVNHIDSNNNTSNYFGDMYPKLTNGSYYLNNTTILLDMKEDQEPILNITEFTDSSFTLEFVSIDTTDVINNNYSITTRKLIEKMVKVDGTPCIN